MVAEVHSSSSLGQAASWPFLKIRDTELWAWLTLPLWIVVIYFGLLLAARLGRRFAERHEERRPGLAHLLEACLGPAQLLLGVWLFGVGRAMLPLAPDVHSFLSRAAIVIGAGAGTWLILRLTRLACDRLGAYFQRTGRPHARAVIPLLRKVAQTAVVMIGMLFLLQNLNVDVAAMLAGLGIGGLALALAGQKTVENLFAGVSLVMDQPAKVGDFCSYGGSSGTIEDIGLRSTRIRTAERTVVTIPNSKLAEMPIENFASRDRILLKATLSLRYETTPAQMRGVLEAIRAMLGSRGEIGPNPRVRFVAFTPNSLDLEIYAYVMTRDFNDFLRIREEIYLAVIDIVEQQGTGFASPTPPVVLESPAVQVRSGPAADDERA